MPTWAGTGAACYVRFHSCYRGESGPVGMVRAISGTVSSQTEVAGNVLVIWGQLAARSEMSAIADKLSTRRRAEFRHQYGARSAPASWRLSVLSAVRTHVGYGLFPEAGPSREFRGNFAGI